MEVVEVLFPEIFDEIAWELGTESLDLELQEIQREIFDKDSAEKIISDKIIKVRLKDNKSKILFIHVEVQSYSSDEDAFGERMFRYFYRIWDKFRYKNKDKSEVIAAAIYTYKGDRGKDKKYVYKVPKLKEEILVYNFRTINVEKIDLENTSADNPLKLVFKMAKTLLVTKPKDEDIYKAGGYDLGFHDTDYFYYEIKSRERYSIGDNIYFKQKDVYVSDYEAYKYQDEIIYKYKLRRKNGVWQTKIYNSLLCGGSLEGKILDVQGEEVKLHLNIDKKQDKGEGSWFKYAPPTGNAMYSMPVVGTSARLYFPDESGNEPLVSGCVRSNGSSCAKTSDTTKRYFGTEHGSELEMTPCALNIKGGSASPISISIDDSVGIKITSPKKLTLSADSEIIMKTPKNVKINGVSQINALKSNTQSGFSLETDLHFLSDNIIKNGSSSESYPDFDDEPQAGTMPEPEPPKEEKKGFSWGKLLVAAVAVVAVVAAVATFGVGAVLIGAAIGAACAVASTAVSDGLSGTKSSLGTYVKNALVGAVSGAIFGPFGAFESLGGMLAFGGITGMADSLLNQAVEGKFSLGQTLFDGLIGTATAGLLHGMGKVVSKASSYVKTGIGKVLGKLSAGAKNILNKVSGTADNILGAFSKTSRELFDKVSNKVGNVVTSIKKSAQDLADRISGKFNEVTRNIDNKIDDALRSVAGKADDALNAINKKIDKKIYDLSSKCGLIPEPAGGGSIPYVPPEKIKPVENLISKMSDYKRVGKAEVSRGEYLRNKFKDKYGVELTPQDINNRINLRGAVKDRLDSEIAELNKRIEEQVSQLSKNQIRKGRANEIINRENAKLGPAVAGILDTKTGKIFTEINSNTSELPINLNCKLEPKIIEMPKNVQQYYQHTLEGPGKNGGAHAEVHALNKALNAREDAEVSDMICFVMQTGRDKKKLTIEGLPMARCPHCEYITDGVNYFPESLWYGKNQGRKYGDYSK